MTERWDAWLAALAVRDDTLLSLALAAASLLLAYGLAALLPFGWGAALRRIYRAGALALYGLALALSLAQVQISPRLATLLAAACGVAAVLYASHERSRYGP